MQFFEMDVETFLDNLPEEPIFNLVVTSPPYDIGKSYEKKNPLDEYVAWQKRIIQKIYPRLKKLVVFVGKLEILYVKMVQLFH